MKSSELNRRTLLKGGALAGAALVGGGAANAFASPLLRTAPSLSPERKTKRVIRKESP